MSNSSTENDTETNAERDLPIHRRTYLRTIATGATVVASVGTGKLSQRAHAQSDVSLSHSQNGGAARAISDTHNASVIKLYGNNIRVGGDDSHSFKIISESGESVTVTPDQDEQITLDNDSVVLRIYDAKGAIVDEPRIPRYNNSIDDIPLNVSGDTSIFQPDPIFKGYTVELLDDGNVLTSTDERIYGIGYEGTLSQDSTTGEIKVTFPRDNEVKDSWTVNLVVVNYDSTGHADTQVWTEFEHKTDTLVTTFDADGIDPVPDDGFRDFNVEFYIDNDTVPNLWAVNTLEVSEDGDNSGDVEDIQINRTRSETTVNSPVTVQVVEPDPADGDYVYRWKIINKPTGSDPGLLHGDGEHAEVDWTDNAENKPHAALRPDMIGSYELQVTVKETGEVVGQNTMIIEADEKQLHTIDDELNPSDVAGINADTVSELAKSYAPVLHFHEDEEYFPTRYEAYIENSEVYLSEDDAEDNSVDPVIKEPSLFELGQETIAAEYELSDETNSLYLTETGGEDDFRGDPNVWQQEGYQGNYPRTVYASITKTTVEDGSSRFGPDGKEYIALTYWMFYLFDPKSGGLSSLTTHPSDTESITILFDEQGPQWIAPSQHYSGEYLSWDKYINWGETADNQSADKVDVFPAEGAHSSFLVDTSQYEDGDGIPAQLRWLRPWLNLPIGTEDVYTDETGDDDVWSLDGGINKHPYDLLIFPEPNKSGEDWTEFAGSFISGPGSLPSDLADIDGKLPWQPDGPDRWYDPIPWIEYQMLPEPAVLDAWGEDLRGYLNGPNDHFSRDGVLGEVTSFQIDYWENPGIKPHTFTLKYKVSSNDTSVDKEDTRPVSRGWNTSDTITIPLDDLNLPPDAKVTVSAKIYTYSPSIPSIKDDVDIEDNEDLVYSAEMTKPVKRDLSLRTLDASVTTMTERVATNGVSRLSTQSAVSPGDEVSGSLTVENAGEEKHTFFFSLTLIGENGTPYDPGEPIGKSVTLAGGEQRTVEITWTVDKDIPEDQYDIRLEGWYDSDPNNLVDQLVSQTAENVFTVIKPEGTLSVSTTPDDTLVTIRGQFTDEAPITESLPIGSYKLIAVAEEYDGVTQTVQVEQKETTRVSLDLVSTTDSEEENTDTQDTDDSDGFGPGFGVGGALAVLGGAGYMLKRRFDDGDDES